MCRIPDKPFVSKASCQMHRLLWDALDKSHALCMGFKSDYVCEFRLLLGMVGSGPRRQRMSAVEQMLRLFSCPADGAYYNLGSRNYRNLREREPKGTIAQHGRSRSSQRRYLPGFLHMYSRTATHVQALSFNSRCVMVSIQNSHFRCKTWIAMTDVHVGC